MFLVSNVPLTKHTIELLQSHLCATTDLLFTPKSYVYETPAPRMPGYWHYLYFHSTI